MLILFAGECAPALSNLHIRDSETDLNIPVAGNTGWADDFLQAQTLCYVPLVFEDAELALAALAETLTYWCHRKSKAILRVNFLTSGANAVIRPLYTDSNGIVSVGDSVTITAIARQDGTAYMSPLEIFELYGANKIAFVIDSISVGTIDVRVTGV